MINETELAELLSKVILEAYVSAKKEGDDDG